MPQTLPLFINTIKNNLPFLPTNDQRAAIENFAAFMFNPSQPLFVLGGYAGTGKTSLIISIVKSLPALQFRSALLAPTGRAAKVMKYYTARNAFTIHKWIYSLQKDSFGNAHYALKRNKAKQTLFIVDEAGMVGNSQGDAGEVKSLLNDLFEFVANGEMCKVMLIGDAAQLPPVGMNVSPALNLKDLKSRFLSDIPFGALKEVVRQEAQSLILKNATITRTIIRSQQIDFPKLEFDNTEVFSINAYDFSEYYEKMMRDYGEDEVCIVCQSNRIAKLYNLQIRSRIKYYEEELSAGDRLMVVKNNYYWSNSENPFDFIANGDLAIIQKVIRVYEMYTTRYAEVMITLADDANEESFRAIVNLEALYSHSPALESTKLKEIYTAIEEDYAHITDCIAKKAEIAKDPHLNAMVVKFGYAVTCHKAQGGQWQAVFIDQGYIAEEKPDLNYLRWLYTAITRAKSKLFFVNFSPKFFEKN
jgi:exodeoxyribonuclease-5